MIKTPVKPFHHKTAETKLRTHVDYPQQGEKVTSRHYTVRVEALEADEVQISIDQGSWLQCRDTVGYWWYDWTSFDSGEHEVIARARNKHGRWQISVPHEFFVE